MTALLLTLLVGAEPSPPAWPAREHLVVGTWQLVFDAPPTTEAELLRRQGRYGFELRWHAVSGVSSWRVFREKQLVATLGAEARSFQSETKGEARYSVEGCNEQQRCTSRITAMVAFDEPGPPEDEGGVVATVLGDVIPVPPPEPDEPARVAWTLSLGAWVKQRFEAQLKAGPPVEAGTVLVQLTVKRDGTISSARLLNQARSPVMRSRRSCSRMRRLRRCRRPARVISARPPSSSCSHDTRTLQAVD